MIRSGRGTGSLLDEFLVAVVGTGCAHVVSSSGYSIHILLGLQASATSANTTDEERKERKMDASCRCVCVFVFSTPPSPVYKLETLRCAALRSVPFRCAALRSVPFRCAVGHI